jgi:2-polyprenyl-6-hydroxyphenyl methylase/3-demethylubiquinone-9 3-methyltransferase
MNSFAPIVPPSVACKCCGGSAKLYGLVDFNKNCEAFNNRFPLPLAGIPVYYHRCGTCGLIFTVAFDSFSKDDFARHIYNETYALVDPEYAEGRPTSNAGNIERAFGGTKQLRILDYGGGNGKLAELLTAAGFANVRTYDPFVPASSKLPTQKFQLITCFEVVEHSPTPMSTFAEMVSLLAEGGLIWLSTLAQPANIDQLRLNWWYAGPRNGHVTLYSVQALERMGQAFGLNYASQDLGTHVFYRDLPEFARHLMK